MSGDYLYFVAYLFAAAGAAVLVVSFWNLVRAIRSAGWPECRGIIIDSKLEKTSGEGGLFLGGLAAAHYR